MRRLRANQYGDTIVEVLIAITIVSVVLAGAFTSATNSSGTVRDAQERGEALKLLESQVEKLRVLANKPGNDVYTPANDHLYCLSNAPSRVIFSFATLPSLAADDFTQYPVGCKDIQKFYNLSVKFDPAKQNFTFTARWDAIGGGRDEESLVYLMPKAVSPAPAPGGAGTPDLATDRGCDNTDTDPDNDCKGSSTKASFYAGIKITLAQAAPGHHIVHCEIDWGDGNVQDVLAECQDVASTGNERIIKHKYPNTPKVTTSPDTYNCTRYNITVRLRDNSPPPNNQKESRTSRVMPGPSSFCAAGTPAS